MRCPVCANSKNFKSLQRSFCKTNNFLCEKCGLVFIPRDNNRSKNYYKEDGYFKKSPNIAYRKNFISKSLLVNESERRIADALALLSLDLRGKKILDVGCGYGEMLYVFRSKYGCEVEGVEASTEAASYGTKIFSVSIHPTLFEDFSSKMRFDVIWCSHVLEHSCDPQGFIEKIRELIKSQGYIYLEVPNILRPSGGFNLEMFLYEEHLQTFSSDNLIKLLRQNGLAPVAYSDSGFLKFWCRNSKGSNGIKYREVSPKGVFSFLKKYKKEYGIVDYLKVYKQKILYGIKIILYKLYDLVGG